MSKLRLVKIGIAIAFGVPAIIILWFLFLGIVALISIFRPV